MSPSCAISSIKEGAMRIKLALALAGDPEARLWPVPFAGSQGPNAPRWRAKASGATPPRARLTLLQPTSETAPEAHPAKVLT
jgi:hypothetical protein